MDNSNKTLTSSIQSFSKGIGIAVFLSGCLVVLGWILDIGLLKSVWPGFVAMKMNTAICFALMGISLFLLNLKKSNPKLRLAGQVSAAIVALTGILTLIEYIFNANLYIDQLILSEQPNATGTTFPGRMAVFTALNFFLLGLSILLMYRTSLRTLVASQVLAIAAFAAGYFAVAGYIYNMAELLSPGFSTKIALHTAILFTLSPVGILFSKPGYGLTRFLAGSDAGSVLMQRLLPAVLLIPPLVELVVSIGHQTGLYSQAIEQAYHSLIIVISLILLSWWLKSSIRKTEQEVRRERFLLDSILESLPGVFYLFDSNGKFLRWNKNFEKITDYSSAEFGQLSPLDLFHGKDKTYIHQRIQNVFTAGKSDAEANLISREGTKIPFYFTGLKITYEGKPCLIGVGTDITALKQAEDKLRVSEERYRDLYENAPDMFLSVNAETSEIAACNETYVLKSGYSKEETIGKKVFEIYHPDCRENAEKAFRQFISSGEIHDEELLLKRKDGSKLDVSLNVVAVRDNHGRILFSRSSLRDITERKHAEEALKQSERRFHDLAESLPQLVWTCLPHGPCDYLSKQWVDYTGIAEEEQLGYGWLDQVHPDDKEPLIDTWQASVTKESLFDVEFRIRRHDGVYHWFKTRAVPVKESSGKLIKWFGSNTDVHDLITAEEELKKHKDHLEELVKERTAQLQIGNEIIKNMSEGVYLIRASDGIIVFANPQFETMFGYKTGELTGKHLSIVNAPADKNPEETAKEIMEALLKNSVWKGEVHNIKKDGITFWCHASVSTFQHPDYGSVWISVHEDITERKNAEQALLESEEKFRKTAATARDAMIICNSLGNVSYWNEAAEKILGYAAEEVMGKELHTIISPGRYLESYHKGYKIFGKTGAGPVIDKTQELEALKKDGSEIPIELSVSSFQLRGEWNALGILRDISERKRAEEALRKAHDELEKRVWERTAELARSNADLEQFAYIASHDLQEPLRMVSSFTQLLAERYKGKLDSKADQYIHYAVDGANRMQLLINDLLDFSRVTSRSKAFIEIDSSLLVANAMIYLKTGIAETKTLITNEDLPVIYCDESQLTRVFQNLIDNAIKYRGKNTPLITISAQTTPAEWIFKVQDNGLGINMDYKEKIFDIFQRLDPGKFPGTGIGLAICKKIIERHGGNIWVESEEGKGSAFYFTIPRKKIPYASTN